MKETRVSSANTFFGWFNDRLYDTVFHLGDTTSQFLWDMSYGPENSRTPKYHDRKLKSQERQGETPLTRAEKITFEKVLKRYDNEKMTDYWKRRKALLAFPNKPHLVKQYEAIDGQKHKVSEARSVAEKQAEKQKIEDQFRAISSLKNAQISSQKFSQKP